MYRKYLSVLVHGISLNLSWTMTCCDGETKILNIPIRSHLVLHPLPHQNIMATPYTPPTSISTEPLPSPTSTPYPAKTKISTDGATALTATSILLADKLMFTLVRGAAAPSSWVCITPSRLPQTLHLTRFIVPRCNTRYFYGPGIFSSKDRR